MADEPEGPTVPNAIPATSGEPPRQPGADLAERLDRATLEKAELEQKEIALRIAGLSNWKQRWAQLAISFIVPTATAALALLAAYIELRSVRSERDQLTRENQSFEQRKAADYTAAKISQAADALKPGQDTTAAGRVVILNSLQELLLAGAKLPESSIDAIFPFLVDPDQRVADAARAILDNSGSPAYARLLASALITPTPPVNYKLAHIVTNAQFSRQNLDYIAPLVLANDSVVAGNAMRTLALNSNAPLNTLVHLDDGASDYERMTYLVTSIITRDPGAQRASLKFIADRLQSDRPFNTDSYEFYSACALNRQGDGYSAALFDRPDISPTNKILLGITFPKPMRAPAAAIATSIFHDAKATAKLARSVMSVDFIASALGMDKPVFTIDDFGSFDPDEIEALENYINFDQTPRSILVTLREKIIANSRSSDTTAIDVAIIKQDEYDLSAVERDGIDAVDYFLRASSSGRQDVVDAAYESFKSLIQKKDHKTRPLEGNEIQIAANFVKAGKSDDLFDAVYAYSPSSPFYFLADLEDVALSDRAYATNFLKKMLQTKDMTPLPAVMMAIMAGLESEFTSIAQDAFEEQLGSIGSIEQRELRQHPDNSERDIDRSLMLLSLLTESPSFKQDVGRLKSAVTALGWVPTRGLGVHVFFHDGDFAVQQKDGYAKLAQVLLPDIFNAIKQTGCDGHPYDEIVQTDQLKELVWSAIFN